MHFTLVIRPKRYIALGEYWIYPEGPKNGLHAAGTYPQYGPILCTLL